MVLSKQIRISLLVVEPLEVVLDSVVEAADAVGGRGGSGRPVPCRGGLAAGVSKRRRAVDISPPPLLSSPRLISTLKLYHPPANSRKTSCRFGVLCKNPGFISQRSRPNPI